MPSIHHSIILTVLIPAIFPTKSEPPHNPQKLRSSFLCFSIFICPVILSFLDPESYWMYPFLDKISISSKWISLFVSG